MTKDSIKLKIREVLSEYIGSPIPETLTDDLNISNELGLDSLDTVEVVIRMEKEFNVVLTDDAVEKTKTINDFTEKISELLQVTA